MQIRRHILIGFLIVATLWTGCTRSGQPSLTEATLAERINEKTKQPEAPVLGFPANTRTFYLSVKVVQPVRGTRVEARWLTDSMGNDRYLTVGNVELQMPGTGNRYLAFRLEAKDQFPGGKYKVQLYVDGKLAQELPFTVAGPPSGA